MVEAWLMCGRIEFYSTRAAGERLIMWIDARLPAPERDIDPGELLLAGCSELDQGWLRNQHQLDELHMWVCDGVPEHIGADPHIVVYKTFLAPVVSTKTAPVRVPASLKTSVSSRSVNVAAVRSACRASATVRPAAVHPRCWSV